MHKLISLAKKGGFAVLVTLIFAGSALAIANPSAVPNTFSNLGQSIRTIFNVVIIISAIAFVILFLVGGIQYLTASGNEEQSGKARKLLLDAVIGLVIVLAAWGIGGWIISQFTGGAITTQTIPES